MPGCGGTAGSCWRPETARAAACAVRSVRNSVAAGSPSAGTGARTVSAGPGVALLALPRVLAPWRLPAAHVPGAEAVEVRQTCLCPSVERRPFGAVAYSEGVELRLRDGSVRVVLPEMLQQALALRPRSVHAQYALVRSHRAARPRERASRGVAAAAVGRRRGELRARSLAAATRAHKKLRTHCCEAAVASWQSVTLARRAALAGVHSAN